MKLKADHIDAERSKSGVQSLSLELSFKNHELEEELEARRMEVKQLKQQTEKKDETFQESLRTQKTTLEQQLTKRLEARSLSDLRLFRPEFQKERPNYSMNSIK